MSAQPNHEFIPVVYTVEFQKRGLPHAHIVLWLAASDKLLTIDDIDHVISAEILDKEADPLGFKLSRNSCCMAHVA